MKSFIAAAFCIASIGVAQAVLASPDRQDNYYAIVGGVEVGPGKYQLEIFNPDKNTIESFLIPSEYAPLLSH